MSDFKAPSKFVDDAYNLEDADMVEFYRKWAAEYDHEMLDKLGYTSPASIAAILIEQLPDTTSKILDLGCGTGLTCRLLAEQGYGCLDGIDISREMLKVSHERGIYRELQIGDLNEPLQYDSDSEPDDDEATSLAPSSITPHTGFKNVNVRWCLVYTFFQYAGLSIWQGQFLTIYLTTLTPNSNVSLVGFIEGAQGAVRVHHVCMRQMRSFLI